MTPNVSILEFKRSFSEHYPSSFLKKYDQLELLASGHATETFLVREKATGELFVAKCFDRSEFSDIKENSILKGLRFAGLPEYAGSFEDARTFVTVRRYIEGTPLDAYVKKRRPDAEEAVRICTELTRILDRLHTQTPPVIHRDIKPENVIVRPDGSIVLIDFETARRYSAGAEADTEFFGTRVYAPPEQYGFAQTDCRADIYSTGVLLRFLLTGSARGSDAAVSPALGRIIKRCTAFSPEDRYPSAKRLEHALGRTLRPRISRARLACIVSLTALLSAAAVFGAVKLRAAQQEAALYADAVFAEPLIEAAACASLGKGANEPLTVNELLDIKELYIFGTEASADAEAFSKGLGADRTFIRGGIVSLEDLALMPNITTLEISYQLLDDLSGIEVLTNAEMLTFKHCFISYLTPLCGMERLRCLSIYDTRVEDMACLATCPHLDSIDAGATLISSCEAFPATDTLRSLSIKQVGLVSLDGIERMTHLETLELTGASIGSCAALEKLIYLRQVRGAGTLLSAETEAVLLGRGVELIEE